MVVCPHRLVHQELGLLPLSHLDYSLCLLSHSSAHLRAPLETKDCVASALERVFAGMLCCILLFLQDVLQ